MLDGRTPGETGREALVQFGDVLSRITRSGLLWVCWYGLGLDFSHSVAFVGKQVDALMYRHLSLQPRTSRLSTRQIDSVAAGPWEVDGVCRFRGIPIAYAGQFCSPLSIRRAALCAQPPASYPKSLTTAVQGTARAQQVVAEQVDFTRQGWLACHDV